MKLHWYGHSCFLLTNAAGKTLLFDPFNENYGYPVPNYEAEVVLTSHEHKDHASTECVKPGFELFSEAGEYEAAGFRIKGIASFHDDQEGAVRGNNIIFVVEADGERVCHMGDIGHILPDETATAVGPVDVLLQPVGGGYTVDGTQALEICGQLRPKTMVPMHYKTKDCSLGIAPLDVFVREAVGKVLHSVGNDLMISAFPGDGAIALMSYDS